MQACAAGQWVVPNAASGARYTLGLMSRRWRYGQSRSRAAVSGMRQCYQTCSIRSRRAKRLAASQHPLMHVKMHCRAVDGAYDTRRCHDAIAARNAHAVIPPRKNAKMWKPDTPGARARNEAVRSTKYLGHSLWRNLTGYHRRSRVETADRQGMRACPRGEDASCEIAGSAPLGAGL
jgi:Transposase DDE domain